MIVPSKRQAQRKAPEPFNKQTFKYDKEQDCYFCPEGHRLKLSTIEKKTGGKRYLIEDKNICASTAGQNVRTFDNSQWKVF